MANGSVPMTGALNMGGRIMTNVAHIDFSATSVAAGGWANGARRGVTLGRDANGAMTNVAVGAGANAQNGVNRTAIGVNTTNTHDNSTHIRGDLYLDGGTGGIWINSGFGTDWSVKAFTIDHPLDPENKILRHCCLDGPDVWNVYAGTVQLVNGAAVVQLPDYYAALNRVGSESYGLTPIGEALVWLEDEVAGNVVTIAGKRDIKVSWTTKVLRNDPACLEGLRRRPVEAWK